MYCISTWDAVFQTVSSLHNVFGLSINDVLEQAEAPEMGVDSGLWYVVDVAEGAVLKRRRVSRVSSYEGRKKQAQTFVLLKGKD